MGFLLFGPLLALIASCHGAALPEIESLDMDTIMNAFQDFLVDPAMYMEAIGVRAKRHTHTEDHTGYKQFPLPVLGAEVGIKYNDEHDRAKGGEAYLHVDDLKHLIPTAHSRHVKLHAKFDGGASTHDGLFTAQLDYHLEHSDGDGTEEGGIEIVREKSGGQWHTKVKSHTDPFSGVPIISSKISNIDLDISSDRRTNLKAKYFNGPQNRDLTVDIKRDPGKSIKAIITNKGVVSTIDGVLTKKAGNDVSIKIDANIRGVKYEGQIDAKLERGKGAKLKIDVKKGAESVAQILVDVKQTGGATKFRGKYAILGGKVAQGTFQGKYEHGAFEIKAGEYELAVKLQLGKSIEVEAKQGGVVMWSYKTDRTTVNNAQKLEVNAVSEMTLNPASKLHKFIADHYPFGAFQTRKNTFKLFIDKQHRNTLLRQFKLDFCVEKDGAHVIDIEFDTTKNPYTFEITAPNLFHKLGSSKQTLTATVDHKPGQSLSIVSNIGRGVSLDINHTPNSHGGRQINVLATRGGEEMFKYHGETSKTNNANIFKVGLKGEFELNPASHLYNLIVSKYRLLTPFTKRNSDLEFFFDKHNKNVLFNKWYAKAKIDKDGTNVFNLDISTNQQPYKLKVFFPALLGKLRPGMTEVDVEVTHTKGQLLELKVKHAGAKFKGFKISRTGPGNEREVEWNGRKLGSGDYELTDHSFKTTQTLSNGKSLTTTITWKSRWETPAFFTDNDIKVVLDGTERQLNLDLKLRMSKLPDLDFSTPEQGTINLKAVGHNARWGDYTINRDITFSSQNRKLAASVKGDASFSAGNLASSSPIHTDINLTYDQPTHDLEGKIEKVVAGKHYSITFPHGSFVLPSIRLGA